MTSTTKNILIGGAVLVGGVLLYKHLQPPAPTQKTPISQVVDSITGLVKSLGGGTSPSGGGAAPSDPLAGLFGLPLGGDSPSSSWSSTGDAAIADGRSLSKTSGYTFGSSAMTTKQQAIAGFDLSFAGLRG
jgi:hypothetical protein